MQNLKVIIPNYNSKFKIFYFLVAFLTFNFALLTFAPSALAHVLKTDGSIGAVLHIAPDDDPVVGESSSFFFDMKDKDDLFNPSNCDCSGSILKDDKIIFSDKIFQDNPNPGFEDAVFSYTFPEKGIYKVRFEGKPIGDKKFQEFVLNWDVRVDRELSGGNTDGDNNSRPIHVFHITLIGLTVIFFGWFILKNKR